MDALLKKDLENRQRQPRKRGEILQNKPNPNRQNVRPIPRSALCPCKSGQNDERRASGQASSPDCSVPGNASGQRCSGKNAPPVVSSPAA